MRLCELKQKKVINTPDCKVLGCVTDLDFDCETGMLQALIVPAPGKFCTIFLRESEYVIPWKQVCKIGPDIILVDVCEASVRKKMAEC